jgi:hypothetical protein
MLASHQPFKVPERVELCARDKDRFPCLGVVHRLEPDGRIYCTRCGGSEPGVVYVRTPSA